MGGTAEIIMEPLFQGFQPSRDCHPEERAAADSHPKAPETFHLDMYFTLSSAQNITLLLLPFFFIGVTHWHLLPQASQKM